MSAPSVVLIAAQQRGGSVCAWNPTLKRSQDPKKESGGMGEGNGVEGTGQRGSQKCLCVSGADAKKCVFV